jgi:deoxyribonuclease V
MNEEWPWPAQQAELEAQQQALAVAADAEPPWEPASLGGAPPQEPQPAAAAHEAEPARLGRLTVAAVFAAFPRGEGGPGVAGQPVVTAAVLWRDGRAISQTVVHGASGGPYVAGLLALRCGALLEAAVDGLPQRPDLVLVDATGRDHPRRAGLALHLGARLGLPSVGVTNRVLVAEYEEPGAPRGSASPLRAGEELVGYAVRTRAGARPVLAHAAWHTTPEMARDVVLALSRRWRTPLPLRAARTLARMTRAGRGHSQSLDAKASG